MKVKLKDLTPHLTNSRIYSPTDLSDLVVSLESHGQLEPISITKQKTIISGHRRLEAMIHLGWFSCEVRIVNPKNEVVALIEHNNQRQKTHADILNEMKYLERELKQEIGRGRYAARARSGKGKHESLRLTLALANKLGLKETQVKKLRTIAKDQPKLIDKIDQGKITLNKAYNLVIEKRAKTVAKTQLVVDEFEIQLGKLLREHQPSVEKVEDVLKKIWPYTLTYTDVSEERRDELIAHLEYLKQMDSYEYTLAQKQDELLHSDFSKQELRKAKSYLPTIKQLEKFMSSGFTKDDIELLVVGDSEVDRKLWNVLRLCIHNMEHNDGPGRRMSAVVGFRVNQKLKILGLISFQSPSRVLKVRDEYIGWSVENMKQHREHIVNLHVCVSSQPFGHNFLGGKFLTMMAIELVKPWEKKYKTKIVAIETTALHGEFSQYSSIKWWRKLGSTEGKILLRPFREIRSFWRTWLRENYQDVYDHCLTTDGTVQSSPLQNVLKNIYTFMGIKLSDYQHGIRRGVFFCELYSNTVEFLTGKTKRLTPLDVSKEKTTNTLFNYGKGKTKRENINDVWFEWWFKKATNRYEVLVEEKRSEEKTLFHQPTEEHYQKIESWLRSRGVKKPYDFSDFKV